MFTYVLMKISSTTFGNPHNDAPQAVHKARLTYL